MDKILDKLMAFINGNEELDDDQYEIVRYGLEIFIIKVTFFGVAAVISIFMRCLLEYIIFFALFSMLRSYAGGYHAKTRISCFIQSMLTIAAALFILKISKTYTYVIFPLFVVAAVMAVIIWIFSPVDTENRRLDNEEKTVFRKRARITLLLEMICGIAAVFIGFRMLSCAAMLSVIVSGILLLRGIKKNIGGDYGQ